MADYYDTLGVARNASKDDIKKAFKRLARQYHPDVAEDKQQAERKFGEINEAYSILGDDEKRAYYDRYGSAPATNGPDAGGGGFGFGGFPFGDLFESIFDLGGGGRGRQQPGFLHQNSPLFRWLRPAAAGTSIVLLPSCAP